MSVGSLMLKLDREIESVKMLVCCHCFLIYEGG